MQETTKSLEINAAKPNKEEITSSKLIVEAEPEVGDPSANLPAQSDMINNTKEVSSTSSGAKNVDISSKSDKSGCGVFGRSYTERGIISSRFLAHIYSVSLFYYNWV